MKKEKWKVELKILADEKSVWVVRKGRKIHKDYLGREMKFNSRENAERMANYLAESTLNNKLTGETDFLLGEGLIIHKTFFPELDITYLFKREF